MSSHSAIVAIRSALHVRTMTSAVLALAVVVGTHTEVRAADERPDLKIELVGLPLSNAAREVQVRARRRTGYEPRRAGGGGGRNSCCCLSGELGSGCRSLASWFRRATACSTPGSDAI
jgi:hypothetical protein